MVVVFQLVYRMSKEQIPGENPVQEFILLSVYYMNFIWALKTGALIALHDWVG